jgi:hypothetical protein
MSNSIKWYTSGIIQTAEKVLHSSCPELEEGMNYEAMGLKWNPNLLMPHRDYPALDDRNPVN